MIQTSWGRLVNKVYRLHITCPAKHTTWIDYATKRTAIANFSKMTDHNSWYATHIEVITIDKIEEVFGRLQNNERQGD